MFAVHDIVLHTIGKYALSKFLSLLIGLFTASDVESMLEEIIKMKDLHHPNVMSLIGVCLDAGPGVSIVMPFMANGSLLEYLKIERGKIYLSDMSELEDVSQNLPSSD